MRRRILTKLFGLEQTIMPLDKYGYLEWQLNNA